MRTEHDDADASVQSTSVARAARFVEIVGHTARREFLYSHSVLQGWESQLRLVEAVLMGLRYSQSSFPATHGRLQIGVRLLRSAERLWEFAMHAVLAPRPSDSIVLRERNAMSSRALDAIKSAGTHLLGIAFVLRAGDKLLYPRTETNFSSPESLPLPPGWGPRSVFEAFKVELHEKLRGDDPFDLYLKTRQVFLAAWYGMAAGPRIWRSEATRLAVDLHASALDRLRSLHPIGSHESLANWLHEQCARALEWQRDQLAVLSCESGEPSAPARDAVRAAAGAF